MGWMQLPPYYEVATRSQDKSKWLKKPIQQSDKHISIQDLTNDYIY